MCSSSAQTQFFTMSSTSEFGYHPVYAANTVTSGIVVQKANVTQATSITTGVTANGSAGVITTVSSTLAADASATFTLTNSKITADSVVLLQVAYGGTTAGNPIVVLDSLAAGSVDIILTNAGTAALDATVDIHFMVL